MYFVALGNVAIWDANEAYYVETPREMLEAHDLVNPTFNYEPRFNKPVLSYWIVAALYKVFGISVGVQRFGIAVGAMLIVWAAFILGRLGGRLGTTRDPGPETTRDLGPETTRDPGPGTTRDPGLWAAAGLLAAPRLMMFARRIFIDIWLTAFTALTLTFFALSEAYPERRRRYLLLMYVSVGLGVLTKGPIAIALPGMAFALYLIVRRELGRVREMMLPAGALIVAAIVVPWYAALYHQHGWTHIRAFLLTENVERFTEGVGVQMSRPWWFYVPVVFSDSFPWSLLLPLAAVLAWRSRSRLEVLLWCWIATIVAFHSYGVGKQDLYIFPIVPAVAALGGMAIARGLAGERPTLLSVTLAVGGGLLAVAGGGVLYLFQAAGRIYALESALLVGLIAAAGGTATLLLGALRRPAAAALTLVAAMVALNWAFVLRVLPEFERYKPVPGFSQTLAARLQPGDAIVHYQASLPSMTYYLRRHVKTTFDPESFVQAMLVPTRVYGILSDDDYAALAPQLAGRTCVVERRPTFDVKLSAVLARQPLPELLLITNQCQ